MYGEIHKWVDKRLEMFVLHVACLGAGHSGEGGEVGGVSAVAHHAGEVVFTVGVVVTLDSLPVTTVDSE